MHPQGSQPLSKNQQLQNCSGLYTWVSSLFLQQPELGWTGISLLLGKVGHLSENLWGSVGEQIVSLDGEFLEFVLKLSNLGHQLLLLLTHSIIQVSLDDPA